MDFRGNKIRWSKEKEGRGVHGQNKTILEDLVTRSYRCNNGRLFPLYKKLLSIFGTDCATGRYAETPADMVDEIERNEIQSNNLEVEEEYEPFTINQTSSANSSRSSHRKRKRQSDNISDGLEKLAESLDKMIDKSNMQVEMIVQGMVDGIKKKDYEQHNLIWDILTKLDIPVEIKLRP